MSLFSLSLSLSPFANETLRGLKLEFIRNAKKGIEALVHQAFAQQQSWLLDPEASTYNAEIAEGKRLTEEVFERAAEEVRRKAGVPLLSIA